MTDQFAAPAQALERDPGDVSRPLYGATFGEALRRFFKNYFTSAGRASRSEFWWVALATAIVYAVALPFAGIGSALSENGGSAVGLVLLIVGGGIFLIGGIVFGLGSIWLTIRRLHDINASGWWYLPIAVIGIIPLIGLVAYVALLVIGVLPSKPEGIRFDARD